MMKVFLRKFGLLLGCIFFITLIISYLVFGFGGFIPAGEVGRGEWLSFWGNFLAFYGAIFLGFAVVWQNSKANEQIRKANEQTDRANVISSGLLKLEELRLCSNVVLDKGIHGKETVPLSNENSQYDSRKSELFFSIQNRGDAILQQIEISFSEYNTFRSHITLVNGEFKNVRIKIPADIIANQKVCITFTSCYDKKTYGDFRVAFENDRPKMMHYHYYGLSKEKALLDE